MCHWLEPLLPFEALYLHRDGFMMWHKGYQDDFSHRLDELFSTTDQFLYANPGAALLSLRCADLPGALESAAVWEDHALKAQQSKSHHMSWEYAGSYAGSFCCFGYF
jgi:hypothetical protein